MGLFIPIIVGGAQDTYLGARATGQFERVYLSPGKPAVYGSQAGLGADLVENRVVAGRLKDTVGGSRLRFTTRRYITKELRAFRVLL